MDSTLEKVIKGKLSQLVTFILEKHPSANKDQIDLKISELLNDALTLTVGPLKVKTTHNILNSIQEQNLTIKVKKSHYSNYILSLDTINHEFNDLNQAKLVIVPSTKVVIGFEGLNGQIEPLNKELIEICHRYKLRFEVPLNLNINDNDDLVITDEMQGLGLNIADSDDSSADEEE